MKQTRRQFVRTLFVASQGILAGRFLATNLPGETSPPTASSPSLNFLVFGDWGVEGKKDQTQVARQMAVAARRAHPEFVISVGDNFYDDGVKSVEDPLWEKSFENVYTDKALHVPWYCVLGNHDYHSNCDAQIDYHKINPRWNMPARYYQQTRQIDAANSADFFYLDTTPMMKGYHKKGLRAFAQVSTQDVPKQIAWLDTALAASTAPWKFVIGHHPIYSGGEHGASRELVEMVLPILQRHKVQAYFNGHDHDLQHLAAGDVNLFDSGAGSEHTPTVYTDESKFAQACSGFTSVSLYADKMEVRMTDNHGKQVYSTTVPRIPKA